MDPSSIAVIALAVCLFAAFSKKAERSALTAPMFFVAVGFFLAGYGGRVSTRFSWRGTRPVAAGK